MHSTSPAADWREDFCATLGRADTVAMVLTELHRRTSDLGFSFCSFGLRLPLPIARPRFLWVTDYPIAWQLRYVSHAYVGIDPTVRHGLKERLPLVWSAEHFELDSDFWGTARSFGLNHGWSLPVHGRQGSIGMFSVVRDHGALTSAERDTIEIKMVWLAQLAYTVLSEQMLQQNLPEAGVTPTPREREVLLWAAAGKSNPEISTIMGIDLRTVKFHFENLMRKFNAANRTEATIKAMILGVIE